MALASCGRSPSGLEAETYVLVQVNGATLPSPLPVPNTGSYPSPLEITQGSLSLRPDGTFTSLTIIRCRSDLPDGVIFEPSGPRQMSGHGTYSRAGGWIKSENRQSGLALGANYATITYDPAPTTQGDLREVWEYRR